MIPNPFPTSPEQAYNVSGLLPWRLNQTLRENVLRSAPMGAERYAPLGADTDSSVPAGTGMVLGGAAILTVLVVGAMMWNARE